MSATTIFAPAAASPSQKAAPIPRAPPVTIATLSLSRVSMLSFPALRRRIPSYIMWKSLPLGLLRGAAARAALGKAGKGSILDAAPGQRNRSAKSLLNAAAGWSRLRATLIGSNRGHAVAQTQPARKAIERNSELFRAADAPCLRARTNGRR